MISSSQQQKDELEFSILLEKRIFSGKWWCKISVKQLMYEEDTGLPWMAGCTMGVPAK